MGPMPDYQRLAADVLGIRNAPPALARRLVEQALVVEDRREVWERNGERICAAAPDTPGVYVLRDAAQRALYVGKANHLRRRLRTHFAKRRWKGLKAELARACDAEWTEVGSELEALLYEATLIRELQPTVNVQTGSPALDTRAIPAPLRRDVIVLVPAVDAQSVVVVAARADGGCLSVPTPRDGAGLKKLSLDLARFFYSPLGRMRDAPPLAPIVFSWLAGRGAAATRVDPHDARSSIELRRRLAALMRDEALFTERIVVR
jgi:predicted GIY-YIG superfamily endonuclease